VMAALITAASETFMLVYGLPVMALPFLATTLMLLLALTQRAPSPGLQLILARPRLPEVAREAARLERARNGEFGSVPLLPPFHGEWAVYQGFHGKHTHQPPWQHALDFHILERGRSYRTDGATLDDYHCFGLPVVAPASGVVTVCLDALPDNRPGEVDTENNWGNHLLIRLDNGLYALLAHLKQGSIEVEPGAWVRAGQRVAACGSSGRSPQPHLHLHVQQGPTPGSPTRPFHLALALHRRDEAESARFCLHLRPGEGEHVASPAVDPALAAALRFDVGREMRYCVTCEGGEAVEQRLDVRLNLLGELRLHGRNGASAAVIRRDELLALHDRQGPDDALLDLWMLAMGLTPFCEGDLEWQDAPSMHLLPMRRRDRWLAALRWPMGTGLESRYRRTWRGDHWEQHGAHVLATPFGGALRAETVARIDPHLGCREMRLLSDAGNMRAALIEVGQRGDAGIPAWRRRAPDGECDGNSSDSTM